LAQKTWIVPISGTTRLERFKKNIGAVDVGLTPADLKQIDEALSKIKIVVERYADAYARMIDRQYMIRQ
jgi:aryl-alcohol dehydrogenase-like predicted oxidoreductase